jgi:hypothetical protein
VKAERIVNEILEARFFATLKRLKAEFAAPSDPTHPTDHSEDVEIGRVEYGFHGKHSKPHYGAELPCSLHGVVVINRHTTSSNIANSQQWSVTSVSSIKSISFN